MVYEVGQTIDGFRSTDGEPMNVGDVAYVIDPATRKVRAGVLLYRRAIGALVFVDGCQWGSRTGIYRHKANAASAAKAMARWAR